MATSTPSLRHRFQQLLVAWALAAAALTSCIVVADEPTAKSDLLQSVRITGRVVNDSDGRPVPEAEVFLRLRNPSGVGSDSVQRTKADAKGEFTYEVSYPGRYRVWAHRGKFTSRLKPAGGEPVLVTVDMKPVAGPIVLRMLPAVTVRVTITDQGSGRPIPGASVRRRGSDDLPDFQSDEGGVANVEPLLPLLSCFEVWADGYAKQARWLNLDNDQDTELAFALAPGGVIEGVVRDPDGKPVAGALVDANVAGDASLLWSYTQLTDTDGRYRIANLPLKHWMWTPVFKAGYLRHKHELWPSETETRVDITLTPLPNIGSVQGWVVDRDGSAIRGAQVSSKSGDARDRRQTLTDESGGFLLDNLFASPDTPGRRPRGSQVHDSVPDDSLPNHELCKLQVRAKGFSPVCVDVESRPADAPGKVRIVLEPGHRISGRVVDGDDRPLDEVDIHWHDPDHNHYGSASTDGEGRFQIDSLPAECQLNFRKWGYSELNPRGFPLDGDGLATVALSPAGIIRGKVVDARSGQPVRAFNVRIDFAAHHSPSEFSIGLDNNLINPGQRFHSDDGSFELNNMAPGMPLQVTVDADGYERNFNPEIECRAANEVATVEFRMTPEDPATLVAYRGRLTDARGAPLVRAQVRLVASDRREARPGKPRRPFDWRANQGSVRLQDSMHRLLDVVTGGDGAFNFERIPRDAEVELEWRGKGIVSGRREHLDRLDEAEREALEIVLDDPARMLIRVDRRSFPDATQVRVWRFKGRRELASQTTLAPNQDTLSVDELAADTYTVQLFKSSPKAARDNLTQLGALEVELSVGEEKEVVLDSSCAFDQPAENR